MHSQFLCFSISSLQQRGPNQSIFLALKMRTQCFPLDDFVSILLNTSPLRNDFNSTWMKKKHFFPSSRAKRWSDWNKYVFGFDALPSEEPMRSLSLLYFAINIHARHWGKRRQEAGREWHFRAALFHFLQSSGPCVPRRSLLYCLLSLPLSMPGVFHQSCISAHNPMMHHLLPLFCANLNQLQSTHLDEDEFFSLLTSPYRPRHAPPLPFHMQYIRNVLMKGCAWWKLRLAQDESEFSVEILCLRKRCLLPFFLSQHSQRTTLPALSGKLTKSSTVRR